jgi:hypothetical protein
MTDTLQARILDPHTVLLGQGAEWIRLSLPWLAAWRVLWRRTCCQVIAGRVPLQVFGRMGAVRAATHFFETSKGEKQWP